MTSLEVASSYGLRQWRWMSAADIHQGPAGSERLRGLAPGSLCVPHLSALACRTRAVRRYRPVPSLSGLLPALTCASRIRLPSASPACCDRPEVESFHLHPVGWRLVAHRADRPHLRLPPARQPDQPAHRGDRRRHAAALDDGHTMPSTCRPTTPRWSPHSPCDRDQVWSSIVAVGAFRCTDLMPFLALAFVS